jgi:outer membrane lipoprotein carrier protein
MPRSLPMLRPISAVLVLLLTLGAADAATKKTLKKKAGVTLVAAAAKPSEAAKPPAPGVDLEAVALAGKVQKFYENTQDFTADVAQTYQYFAANRTMKASGQMQLKKPGMMRWDIVKPSPQLYLLDGKALYQYDAEDNEVRVKKDFTSYALPAAVTFLWGKGRLTDEFTVTKIAKPEYGATVLELTPKKAGSGFRKLFFALDAATGQVQTSIVIDGEGNENRLSFSNVKTNVGLPAARFVFELPKGATVQEL